MWVTHQNLARSKGGRPAYQQPPKKKKGAPAPDTPKTEATDTPTDAAETDAAKKP